MNQTLVKLTPMSKAAKRFAAKKFPGRKVTDRDVLDFFGGFRAEWREIPLKIAMMNSLLAEAWGVAHMLAANGVQFAGTMREATLVIAGTAYAAWRISIDRKTRKHETAHPAMVAAGLAAGIEYAMHNKAGMPAMYADDYVATVSESDDPVDGMTPLEALAQLWPKNYSDRAVRFRSPRLAEVADDSWAAQFWETRPNVLTTPVRDLERARKAGIARWRATAVAKRKAK